MFFTLLEPSFPYRRHHSNWDKLLLGNPGGVVSTPGRSFLFQGFLTSTIVLREGLSSCPDIKHLAWLCRWNTNRKETWSSTRNFQSSRTTFVIMIYNKFPQNTVSWNYKYWLDHPFLGSGSGWSYLATLASKFFIRLQSAYQLGLQSQLKAQLQGVHLHTHSRGLGPFATWTSLHGSLLSPEQEIHKGGKESV